TRERLFSTARDHSIHQKRLGITPRPPTVPGFTYTPAYTLTPGQPPPGRATHLRHPIRYLLQARHPHQQPQTTPRPRRTPAQLASPASVLDARARVREYQPVLHRLRLSASP